MTLEQDRDGLIRLTGALLWIALSLAFFTEIGAIVGWVMGNAARGAAFGPWACIAFWLWVLWHHR